jgi:hypothetical protein
MRIASNFLAVAAFGGPGHALEGSAARHPDLGNAPAREFNGSPRQSGRVPAADLLLEE